MPSFWAFEGQSRCIRFTLNAIAGYENLEPFELPPCLAGLEARIADHDLRPYLNALQPVPERREKWEREQSIGSVERPQGPVAALVRSRPSTLKFIPWCLPFVEHSVPDPSPALQAAHRPLLTFWLLFLNTDIILSDM
jgi:hypothetical protein